jgi:hypothetical protein
MQIYRLLNVPFFQQREPLLVTSPAPSDPLLAKKTPRLACDSFTASANPRNGNGLDALIAEIEYWLVVLTSTPNGHLKYHLYKEEWLKINDLKFSGTPAVPIKTMENFLKKLKALLPSQPKNQMELITEAIKDFETLQGGLTDIQKRDRQTDLERVVKSLNKIKKLLMANKPLSTEIVVRTILPLANLETYTCFQVAKRRELVKTILTKLNTLKELNPSGDFLEKQPTVTIDQKTGQWGFSFE